MRRSILVLLALIAGCEPGLPDVVLHPEDNPPDKLSDWGVLIRRGDFLVLNTDVLPYELNVPLFSDYAQKMRTVWLPPGSSADYSFDREFEFPVGTIISKTFHYESRGIGEDGGLIVARVNGGTEFVDGSKVDLSDKLVVETRLLVRYESGWKGLPYVWNDAQDEAWLSVAGDYRTLQFADDAKEFVYIVPDANQCAGCHTVDHTAKKLRPIGPKAWQLNRSFTYAAGVENQLTHWSDLGLLSGVPDDPATGVRWLDTDDGSTDERARAYLDINCAHCHNPQGAADTSALHLNLDAEMGRHVGICKSPVAVGQGSGNRPYDIYPGRPDESILLFRMQHTNPAIAMPELGRSTVHREGVSLIRHWIAQMRGRC